MLVKVSCPCGSRFAFDVEPLNGQMPVAVNCPSCGADSTALANAVIAQNPAPAASPPPAPEPAAPKAAGLTIKGRSAEPPGGGHAPAPASAPSQTGTSAPLAPGLALKKSSHAASTPGGTSDAVEVPKPAGFKPVGAASPEGNFKLGIVGAASGALIGGGALFALIKVTGITGGIICGLVTMGVGVLAGFGTKLLGRQFNTNLGVIAGACTLVAILTARLTFALGEVQDFKQGMGEVMKMPTYEERLAEAREAVNARTDEEIRAFLRKQEEKLFQQFARKGEQFEQEPITAEDIRAFKDLQLPAQKAFVEGKPSREEYEKEVADAEKAAAEFSEKVSNSWLTKGWVVFRTLGIFQIFWLCASVSTAWRIGSNVNAAR